MRHLIDIVIDLLNNKVDVKEETFNMARSHVNPCCWIEIVGCDGEKIATISYYDKDASAFWPVVEDLVVYGVPNEYGYVTFKFKYLTAKQALKKINFSYDCVSIEVDDESVKYTYPFIGLN